jgi:hypothetical protein
MFRSFACLSVFVVASFAATNNKEVDFQRKVRPILSDNCFLCHGPDKGTRMADLRLDIQEGAMAQRKNGHAVVPGKPDESLLIKRIYSDDANFRMPPVFSHKTLTQEQKDTLRLWIEQGAKWTQHWAFVPPQKAAVPQVQNATWPRNDIDRFILAKIESANLTPAPEADKRTLIRRVTLDLTGLPPTPAETEAFVNDSSPDAYEKVVDRLLASPHYGEQRARYWLDAARYADTNGLHFDNYREMWPYRDWVINAFNKNMPFDRFTVDQLAGDLLPNATLDQKVASGFQRCNETTDEGGVILPEVEAMYAKDRADTTGTVWMGLTVGCATCHDHKFDPIAQKDYYSLTSFFRNTTQPTMDLNVQDTPPAVHVPLPADQAQWNALNQQRKALRDKLAGDRKSALESIRDWLPQIDKQASSYVPENQVLALGISDKFTIAGKQSSRAIPTPQQVDIIDVPEISAKAIRFEKEGGVNLSALPAFDTDKPFTIAMWIYMPDSKESGTIASEWEKMPTDKKDESKHRGWVLRMDKGNLGIYEHAPSFYLNGADGKGISARAIPEYKFKPQTWYHLTITYDGSKESRGIEMYVNGSPVVTIGRPEDTAKLTASTKSNAPVSLGTDGNEHFAGGAVADFRLLSGMTDPESAELLFLSSRFEAAARKPVDQLSSADAEALGTFYTSRVNHSSAATVAQLRSTEKDLFAIRRRSPTTEVMQERTDAEPVAHVLYRGQYDQMRDEVHPNTPSVLPPMTHAMPRNRLGLAMWIVDPANPLTARVTVNRFWQEIFGTGIVRTVEDFGSQGEPPSHPELLDWLAVDYRDSGWDTKRLFKMMVMSATYRQSAATTPEKLAADPLNRLLAHAPRFRMDGEMVRDYALFTSGLLRPEVGGRSVKPYQPPHIWDAVAMDTSNTRFYQQDSGPDLYRRSIYTFWKRAAPPPSMDIFNAPSRETCTVRRERTDTPLQALVTMNDPQFVEASRMLAQNAMKSGKGLDQQMSFMAERVLARPLDAKESEVLKGSYQKFVAYYKGSTDDASKLLKVGEAPADPHLPVANFAALTMVANEMLNLDEALVK